MELNTQEAKIALQALENYSVLFPVKVVDVANNTIKIDNPQLPSEIKDLYEKLKAFVSPEVV